MDTARIDTESSAGDWSIRPFDPVDRSAVREVCFATGYMGDPVEWMWRDKESFADLFSGYWTDHEPESAMVLDVGGRVSGYLLGCVDSRRAQGYARVLLHHTVGRLVLLRPGTAGVLWRAVGDVTGDALLRHRPPPEPFIDDRWPAHLHIDLLPDARGLGAGRALVNAHLERLRRLGSPGCHVETLAENSSAVAFFETVGFKKHGDPVPAPGFRTREGRLRMHLLRMVLNLS